jgi:hypothetical protein
MWSGRWPNHMSRRVPRVQQEMVPSNIRISLTCHRTRSLRRFRNVDLI